MKVLKIKFFLKTLLAASAVCSLFVIENIANAAPRAAVRGTAGARVSSTKTATPAATVETTETSEPVVIAEPEPIEISEPIINKSNQFDDIISSSTTTSSTGSSDLAERIKAQRAAAAAKDAADEVASKMGGGKSGKNACDFGLRECMMKTCGKDFTKCATDGDTILGDKFNKCRRDLPCSGEEFRLFTTEIKADRDMNVRLASYNSVIDCGNEYNGCIIEQCGSTFDKCLGKVAADRATNACKTIATKCKEQDSGLPSRFGDVIGRLRENAEIDVKKDEKRMYELRELMKKACNKLGAMFDERTFDCIYTVSFYAGKDAKEPMASRKRYAGDTFVCTQEWFGVDVTTFKENAYRETRSQKAATSAMLGAGVGTATAMITSGSIKRGLDTQKAKKALDAAKGKGKDAKTDDKDAKSDDKAKEGEEGKEEGKENNDENAEKEDEGSTSNPGETPATADAPAEEPAAEPATDASSGS